MFWKQSSLPISQPQTSSSTKTTATTSTNNYKSTKIPIHHSYFTATPPRNPQPFPLTKQSVSITEKAKNHEITPKRDQSSQNEEIAYSPADSEDSTEPRMLPVDFEKTIRELELVISGSPTVDLDTVRELIMLYTLAVEYYDSKNDDKFIYFKNKIVYLHQQQNVIDAMSIQVAPPAAKAIAVSEQQKKVESNTNKIVDIKNSNHFRLPFVKPLDLEVICPKVKLQQIEEQSQVCITDADVRELLDTEDDKQLEQEVIIEKDLKKQHNIIQKRLSKRIKANQNGNNGMFPTTSQTPRAVISKKYSFEDLLSSSHTESSWKFEEKQMPMTARASTTNYKQIGFGFYHDDHQQKQQKIKEQQSSLHKNDDKLEVNRMIATFVDDKKRGLKEEMKLKMDQLEFHFEKLIFEQEKQSGKALDESERQMLKDQKKLRAEEIQREFSEREKMHIDMIYSKYSAKQNQINHISQNQQVHKLQYS